MHIKIQVKGQGDFFFFFLSACLPVFIPSCIIQSKAYRVALIKVGAWKEFGSWKGVGRSSLA